MTPKTFHQIYLEEDSSDWIDNVLLENTFRKLSQLFPTPAGKQSAPEGQQEEVAFSRQEHLLADRAALQEIWGVQSTGLKPSQLYQSEKSLA